ncbi:MAG: LuxR C-terminal-related transcriptional regulator [Scandinavium sp.]|uniref:LuxR C-terminal-related transcriptional regulator n=1 Tax=Scandinavium sp. TaxID=2830653 RepID=UPI003F309BBE
MRAVGRKSCVIISRLPVYQSGMTTILKENFPEYKVMVHRKIDELTLFQLDNTNLIIIDLPAEYSQGKALCEKYSALMNRYKKTRWIYMVNQALYPLAIEYLLRPESTLLSDAESVSDLIYAIRSKGKQRESISTSLLFPASFSASTGEETSIALTRSERQVLRLLAQGWTVNQSAVLLGKSNKTISAQKNSAMRRLALRGNSELYAWFCTAQGMKELNLLPAGGEPAQWISPQTTSMSL